MVVLLAAAAWSVALATNELRDQTTRTLGLCGVVLFSLLAGAAAAHGLKPWLKARPPGDTTRLTR